MNITRGRRAIDRWEDAPHILGGRDGQAGGSWLAVSESGRVAAVTNVRTGSRTPAEPRAASWCKPGCKTAARRPSLPAGFQAQRGEYAPFNLLFGCLNDLYCFHSPRALLQPAAPRCACAEQRPAGCAVAQERAAARLDERHAQLCRPTR